MKSTSLGSRLVRSAARSPARTKTGPAGQIPPAAWGGGSPPNRHHRGARARRNGPDSSRIQPWFWARPWSDSFFPHCASLRPRIEDRKPGKTKVADISGDERQAMRECRSRYLSVDVGRVYVAVTKTRPLACSSNIEGKHSTGEKGFHLVFEPLLQLCPSLSCR